MPSDPRKRFNDLIRKGKLDRMLKVWAEMAGWDLLRKKKE